MENVVHEFVQHVLIVFLRLFMRWEVIGRTTMLHREPNRYMGRLVIKNKRFYNNDSTGINSSSSILKLKCAKVVSVLYISISGRVIPKTQKMVLDDALLNTKLYKVRIKGKGKQSMEKSSALSVCVCVCVLCVCVEAEESLLAASLDKTSKNYLLKSFCVGGCMCVLFLFFTVFVCFLVCFILFCLIVFVLFVCFVLFFVLFFVVVFSPF